MVGFLKGAASRLEGGWWKNSLGQCLALCRLRWEGHIPDSVVPLKQDRLADSWPFAAGLNLGNRCVSICVEFFSSHTYLLKTFWYHSGRH